ncbi:hypothetical protein, partial [Oleiphilus sp. HI0086]|uniref:hypothetical protein n=1 Tax=Oleiphilus sp. HI0086 TaxID=1822260 RepID=UPI0007C3B2F8
MIYVVFKNTDMNRNKNIVKPLHAVIGTQKSWLVFCLIYMWKRGIVGTSYHEIQKYQRRYQHFTGISWNALSSIETQKKP